MSIEGMYFTVSKTRFWLFFFFSMRCTNFVSNGQSQQPDFSFPKAPVCIWIKINYIVEKVKCTWDTALRKTTVMFSGQILQPLLLPLLEALKALSLLSLGTT